MKRATYPLNDWDSAGNCRRCGEAGRCHCTTYKPPHTPAMLPGMGSPVFGGVVLRPGFGSQRPYTGPQPDLFSRYEEDGLDGPGLFDHERDSRE